MAIQSRRYSNLSIKGKILASFTFILVIFAGVFAGLFISINYVKNYIQNVANNLLPSQANLIDMQTDIFQSRTNLLNWALTKDKSEFNAFQSNWSKVMVSEEMIDKKSHQVLTADEQNTWENIKQALSNVKIVQDNFVNTVSTSTLTDEQIIKKWIDDVTPASTVLLNAINYDTEKGGAINSTGLINSQANKLENEINNLVDKVASLELISIILIILSAIISIFFMLYTIKLITQPLIEAIDIAKNIAKGERDIKIKVTSDDETGELLLALESMNDSIKKNEEDLKRKEIETRQLSNSVMNSATKFSSYISKVAKGDLSQKLNGHDEEKNETMNQLGKDLNMMSDSLGEMTKQITDTSHSMVTTIEEVRHSIDVQSSGATEQASSINEITASLSEIEKSATQTLEKAKTLGETAQRTQEKGRLGFEAVEQSVQGMKIVREKVQAIAQTILDLSRQTQQVGEITSVVNNLAQQSKMLALNASIEAAKAGEAGKGFAVVASEVKNLAEQSEQSTEQVQRILDEIRKATEKAVMVTEEGAKEVDSGTDLIEKTGEIISSLNDVIHEATIASQQIEAAISQEGIGIEQITVGMNEINQVTASFVESVRQTTEAIGYLDNIAKSLKSRVDQYKV